MITDFQRAGRGGGRTNIRKTATLQVRPATSTWHQAARKIDGFIRHVNGPYRAGPSLFRGLSLYLSGGSPGSFRARAGDALRAERPRGDSPERFRDEDEAGKGNSRRRDFPLHVPPYAKTEDSFAHNPFLELNVYLSSRSRIYFHCEQNGARRCRKTLETTVTTQLFADIERFPWILPAASKLSRVGFSQF